MVLLGLGHVDVARTDTAGFRRDSRHLLAWHALTIDGGWRANAMPVFEQMASVNDSSVAFTADAEFRFRVLPAAVTQEQGGGQIGSLRGSQLGLPGKGGRLCRSTMSQGQFKSNDSGR